MRKTSASDDSNEQSYFPTVRSIHFPDLRLQKRIKSEELEEDPNESQVKGIPKEVMSQYLLFLNQTLHTCPLKEEDYQIKCIYSLKPKDQLQVSNLFQAHRGVQR